MPPFYKAQSRRSLIVTIYDFSSGSTSAASVPSSTSTGVTSSSILKITNIEAMLLKSQLCSAGHVFKVNNHRTLYDANGPLQLRTVTPGISPPCCPLLWKHPQSHPQEQDTQEEEAQHYYIKPWLDLQLQLLRPCQSVPPWPYQSRSCLQSTRTNPFLNSRLWSQTIYIYIFLQLCLKSFFHTVKWYQVFLSNINNVYTVVWVQVFLSNTNNYMVSSNYLDWITMICLHTVID